MRTKSRFSDGRNSKSVQSHCLHEDIFNCIVDELLKRVKGAIPQSFSIHGNERLYFVFRGYTFIIKLADQTNNKTKQQDDIRNQNWSNHIITIVYKLDSIRENISTITLKYIEGEKTIWAYVLPTKEAGTTSEIEHEDVVLTPQKPKLRRVNTNKGIASDE